MPEPLTAVAAKIATVLAIKPECFITHPSELHVLRSMERAKLRDFAESRGWRVVWRVGGRQIEFYNDATVRANL